MQNKKSTALRKLKVKYEPKKPTKIKNVLLVLTAAVFSVLINLQTGGLINKGGLKEVYNGLKPAFTGKAEKIGKLNEEITEVIASTENGVRKEETYNPFKEASLPVNSYVTSPFGYRKDPFSEKTVLHRGTDLQAEVGTEVKAVLDGRVLKIGEDVIGGKFILLAHKNGFQSYYGHLSEIFVKSGDEVKNGQPIALSGNTGKVTGAHLHFQLSYNDRYVNPEVYFSFNENKD